MSIARIKKFFAPEAEPTPIATRHFSVPEGVRAYAVGDIHGRASLLKKMLAAIEEDAAQHASQRTVQIFLGDYIDRGMQSRDVVDLLIAPPPKGHERICLMGNHEEALLHFLDDPNILRDWANFGGYATLVSYGIPMPESMSPERLKALRDAFARAIPQAHLDFYKNLPLRTSLGDYLFVHAGIIPGLPLEEQKPEHLLWIRRPFLNYKGYFNHYIVHGHTPVTSAEILPNRANLDISIAAKSSLAALVLEGDERRVLVVEESD
ncbi:MAG: serine/threonine protein phosphatase [Alphaproteobacteria bacterium]|nr:serine/threonine protein phosphatase [Alphaproteobacteria bacterium]